MSPLVEWVVTGLAWGLLQVGTMGIDRNVSEAIEIRFVDRYFYTKDGRRAAGKLRPDGVLKISELASVAEQQRAISLALLQVRSQLRP
jgi:hypothetical protein